jgi:MFS family permease
MTESSGAGAPVTGILAERRWSLVLLLGGVGDIVGSLLPLFIVTALDLPVAAATSAVAAYTGGSLLAQLLLWGRLADRLDEPRILIILGTLGQGALIVGLAVLPVAGGVVGLALVLGAVAVSMDGALLRLALGSLEDRNRLRAASRFSILVQRGALVGLASSTIALALLPRWLDAETALRVVLASVGGFVIVESLLVLNTALGHRAMPRLARSLRDLAEEGALLLFGTATTPIQQLIRFRRPEASPGAGREQVSDTLLIMLAALAVVHFGYAMQGSLVAVYLRERADVPSSLVVAVLLGGSVMTSVGLARISEWLEWVPPVQVQVLAAAVRAVAFALFALIATQPTLHVGIVGFVLAFFVSQLALGGVMASNARRLAALAPTSRRAEVAAWQSGAIGTGAVAGALLGGAIAGGFGYPPAFLTAAVIAGLGAVVLLRR